MKIKLIEIENILGDETINWLDVDGQIYGVTKNDSGGYSLLYSSGESACNTSCAGSHDDRVLLETLMSFLSLDKEES